MAGLPRLLDDGRADALTAAGYEKTSWWQESHRPSLKAGSILGYIGIWICRIS